MIKLVEGGHCVGDWLCTVEPCSTEIFYVCANPVHTINNYLIDMATKTYTNMSPLCHHI